MTDSQRPPVEPVKPVGCSPGCDCGMVWDPRVDGNVVTCPRCKGDPDKWTYVRGERPI